MILKKIFICTVVILFVNIIVVGQADNKKENTFNKIKPALLIIDVQNQYLPTMSKEEKKYALSVINGCIWFFRKNNFPIIRIYHSDLRWGPEEGSETFEYPKSIIINEKDTKVHKHYPSAFIKTELDKILKEKNRNTLFLCGLSATYCVLATYFGALEHEYKAYMIKEGIMSHNPGYTNMIKDICETVSFESMIFWLSKLSE
jgi:nicotinamidase-related amidase